MNSMELIKELNSNFLGIKEICNYFLLNDNEYYE